MTAFLYQRSSMDIARQRATRMPSLEIPNPKSQAPNPKIQIPSATSRLGWDLGFGIWGLGFLCDQISVACEHPSSVVLLAKNRQRVARAVDRRTVFRRDGHFDVVPQVRPIAEDLQLLDIALSLEFHVHHSTGRGCKFLLAERLPAGHDENHVVGHEVQNGLDIAVSCRGHPRVDQVPYGAFIVGHGDAFPVPLKSTLWSLRCSEAKFFRVTARDRVLDHCVHANFVLNTVMHLVTLARRHMLDPRRVGAASPEAARRRSPLGQISFESFGSFETFGSFMPHTLCRTNDSRCV